MPFPVSEEWIAAAEKELGRALPQGLRRRLSQNNGGDVEAAEDDWQLHPIKDASDRKRLSRTANHIVLETGAAREWSNFPANAIVIASNGCGDHLIVLPDCDDIFVWRHEEGDVTRVDVSWD